jgi:hypothetical protein
VEDTWAGRDLPVLAATVSLLEDSYMVTVSDIAGRTGLELPDVARALETLDPTYVDFRKTETGGDPRFWYVLKATPEARREVGQWPTPESLVARLAEGLNVAAERESDPDRKSLLTHTAGLLGETLRDVVIEVVARIIGPVAGAIDPARANAPSSGPEAQQAGPGAQSAGPGAQQAGLEAQQAGLEAQQAGPGAQQADQGS